MNKTVFTNGMKSFDLAQYPPEAWTWYSEQPNAVDNELYSKTSAVFRALELTANATASLPFAVTKNGADFDTSADWQNKVGFLPKPQHLLRLWRMSLFMTNTAYARIATTKTFQGRPVKKELLYVVPTSITPVVSPKTGDLAYFQRAYNNQIARIEPKDLFFIWRLDHTTELLPSVNTEFRALMQSAGVLYWADAWVKNFFERGGVKPAIISVKGMAIPTKQDKEDMESRWSKFVRNISREVAKVINGDAMDVKTFGDGVGDLKNTPVYQNAIANVAMAAGMPLSLLLANSANYATAQVEYAAWYRNSVIPYANLMSEWMNDQLFTPLGLHFEFRPEQTEPNQQEEVERASAFGQYVSAGIKPSIAAQIVGVDLPQGVEYEDLDPEEPQETQPEQPDNSQADTTEDNEESTNPPEQSSDMSSDMEDMSAGKMTYEAWQELEIWKRKAAKSEKRGEPLPVDFVCKHIPARVADGIRAQLMEGKAAFVFTEEVIEDATVSPSHVDNSEAIKQLADAINKALENDVHHDLPVQQ